MCANTHHITSHSQAYKYEGNYLQNTEVLESGEVALGDACEIIPIQLPAMTDMQTQMNN